MTRTGQAAIDYAHSRVGGQMPASGYCLQFVRQCFDVGSYYASAIDAWNGAKVKHPGDRNPPPAVPLYFKSPSVYDHVVFGGGPPANDIVTTFNADIRHYGGDAIAGIERDFDAQYLGWAEDINGVTVYTGGSTPPPTPIPDDEEADMFVLQAPNRGLAVVLGGKVVPIGETNTADALTGQGVGRASISDADFDRLRLSGGGAQVLIKEATRGYALVTGSQAVGIGDMASVYAWQGLGVATIDVPAADFDRLTGGITNAIPTPPPVSRSFSAPALIALVIAFAILVGLVVVLVADAVSDGVYAGAGALLGGAVALAGWALGSRNRRPDVELTARLHSPTEGA